MKRMVRSVLNAGMFAVVVMGTQALTAGPLNGSITDPNPGANPDPDHCTYMYPNSYPMYHSTYYCTYGSGDCRVCYVGVTTYRCDQVLCESTEPF
jgi:hypothetical protein